VVFGLHCEFPVDSDQGTVIGNRITIFVEGYVVIGAEAKKVLHRVGSVMRSAKRPDMGAFCVVAGKGFDGSPTNLTAIVV
jgi:hypothetical protein